MKIAVLSTYAHGGAAIACMRLTDALRAHGHDMNVIVAHNPAPAKGLISAMSYWRWRVHFVAERLSWWRREASKDVRFAFSLANWGKDISQHPAIQNADIIHLHWVNQGFLSLKNLQQLADLGKPIVWTLHDMWAFTGGCHYAGICENYLHQCGNCFHTRAPHDKDISQQIYTQKKQIYTHFQNINVVTSSYWLGSLAKMSSLFQNVPVCNIAIPIDLNLFQPIAKKTAREALGLPLDKKIILFVAANVADKRKGFEWLQKSLELLSIENPELQPVLLVMGKANAEILQKLPYAVHYLGVLNKTEQIAQAYSAADVFAMPSLEDNLPNTIIESLASATPVVAFEVGGIPEMVAHLQTGYLVPARQTADFKAGLHWILTHENPDIINQAARNFALTHYDGATIATAYSHIYQQALSK